MFAGKKKYLIMVPVTVCLVFMLVMPADTAAGEPVASIDGWEWQNPLPQGNDLLAVWGSSATDVYFVGAKNGILHYDGSTWSLSGLGGLTDIWGSSASDVFAVGGGGAILHLLPDYDKRETEAEQGETITDFFAGIFESIKRIINWAWEWISTR